MVQQQPDSEHQDAGLQSLRLVHTSLPERNLDIIFRSGEATEVLERARLPTIFTLLSQRCLRWLGPRSQNGGGPNTQRPSVRGALRRFQAQRPTQTVVQRYLQKRHEVCWNRHVVLASWENLAESRDSWRDAVNGGTKQAERDRTDHQKKKRAARKSSSADGVRSFRYKVRRFDTSRLDTN